MLAGGPVDVLVDDGPSLSAGELPQLRELILCIVLSETPICLR